jgi:hypothetical protein
MLLDEKDVKPMQKKSTREDSGTALGKTQAIASL